MASFFAWFLDTLGRVALALWDAIATVFAWLWSLVDSVLAPVMRPVLAFLNPAMTRATDALYGLLDALGRTAGLTLLSAVFGVLMLVAFKYLSNQKAIERVNNDIKANLLALKLFKDELRVTVVAQVRLFWAILRLQRYMLTPVLILLLPMMIVLAQMGLRYQWRPLAVGEHTTVELRLANDGATPPISLDPGQGAEVEAGPIIGDHLAVWRIRATAPGHHMFTINHGLTLAEKELVVGDVGPRVNPIRSTSWTSTLLYPAESALPKGSPIVSIEVKYPPMESWIHGSDWWVLYFFVVSMAAALILKPVVGVKF